MTHPPVIEERGCCSGPGGYTIDARLSMAMEVGHLGVTSPVAYIRPRRPRPGPCRTIIARLHKIIFFTEEFYFGNAISALLRLCYDVLIARFEYPYAIAKESFSVQIDSIYVFELFLKVARLV